MEIRTVSLIGLGALGVMFSHPLSQKAACGSFRIIADAGRIARYRQEGVYSNGERCDFTYVTPEEDTGPADLVIFAVKHRDLPDAIRAVRRQVGPCTVLLSLLNGILSEEIIAETYGADRILYCTAQGMDAVKTGNRLTYGHMGYLAFGDRAPGPASDNVRRVAAYLGCAGIPYRVVENMARQLWGKFMLNVGINQVIAVNGGNYGTVQQPGLERETMVAAMREVIPLAQKEGVDLAEADIADWLKIVDTLSPDGKPSLSQDLEARRPSEVELFSGTVLKLAEKQGIAVPVNRGLYDRIREMEKPGS